MVNISNFIKQNRFEAIEILKAHNGRINFVEDGDALDNGEWCGNPYDIAVPWVITAPAGLADIAVLAVRLNEKDEIEFYGLDVEVIEASDWFSWADCVANTENEIYEYLGQNYK